jgi:hypothetical protein
VRAGVAGRRSAINSPSAKIEKRITLQREARKAKGEPERFIHPMWAPHATAAGAVMDLNPATNPIPSATMRAEITESLRWHIETAQPWRGGKA